MKTTDSNFATETKDPALGFIDAINEADNCLKEIDKELDKAS
jgi:hypothetical protein